MLPILDYLYPASLHRASPDATYDAQDTGDWSSTDRAAVDDPQNANDGDAAMITHPWGPAAAFATRYRFVSYNLTEPLPGLAVTKITVHAWVTNACSNAVPVDGDFRVFVITGGGALRTLGGANTIGGLRASEYAVDQEWRHIQHSWATNPSTGLAWTLADLVALKVGVRTVALTDPTASSNPTGMITSIYVEIDATSTMPNADQVRHVGSWRLRFRRLPLRKVVLDGLPLQYGDKGPGDTIWLAHRSLPTPDGLGASELAWSRAPLGVTKRTRKGAGGVRLECIDPTSYACRFWSPLVTDLHCDDQANGIAMLSPAGAALSYSRSFVGYAKRQDGLWTQRAAGLPRYHKDYGLLISPSAYAGILNNTFGAFGGGAFTNWGSTLAGAGSFSQDPAYLFDVAGLRACALLSGGGVGGQARLYQDWAAWNQIDGVFRALVGIKAQGRVQVALEYNPGAAYFDFNTLTWGGGGFYEPPAAASGELFEWWSGQIPSPPNGSTVRLHVSVFDANAARVYAATIVRDSAGGGRMVCPHEFPVRTVSAGFTDSDQVILANTESCLIWDWTHGESNFEFTPLWGHADLWDGATRMLIVVGGTATGAQAMAYYERISAVAGRWVFAVPDSAGTLAAAAYNVSAAASNLPARLTTVKVALRWTGVAGELGLTPFTRSIFINGAKGTDAVSATPTVPAALAGSGKIWLGQLPDPTEWNTFAAGYFRHLEIRDWCLRDELIRRLQA
jgi:hypothetical protein